MANAIEWGLWSGHRGPPELMWTSALGSRWTCSSMVIWSGLLLLGPGMSSILSRWSSPPRTDEIEKSKGLEGTINPKKGGVMRAQNVLIPMSVAKGPPPCRVKPAGYAWTREPKLVFPLPFPLFLLHPGCVGVTPSCNGQDMSIHHPNLSKRYSTISCPGERCTRLSPQSGISRCSYLYFWIPIWTTASASRSSTQSVSPHLVQSLPMPLEVSGFAFFFSEDTSLPISRTKWAERARYFCFTHAQRCALSSK